MSNSRERQTTKADTKWTHNRAKSSRQRVRLSISSRLKHSLGVSYANIKNISSSLHFAVENTFLQSLLKLPESIFKRKLSVPQKAKRRLRLVCFTSSFVFSLFTRIKHVKKFVIQRQFKLFAYVWWYSLPNYIIVIRHLQQSHLVWKSLVVLLKHDIALDAAINWVKSKQSSERQWNLFLALRECASRETLDRR